MLDGVKECQRTWQGRCTDGGNDLPETRQAAEEPQYPDGVSQRARESESE
jgi:hypothetical protein